MKERVKKENDNKLSDDEWNAKNEALFNKKYGFVKPEKEETAK